MKRISTPNTRNHAHMTINVKLTHQSTLLNFVIKKKLLWHCWCVLISGGSKSPALKTEELSAKHAKSNKNEKKIVNEEVFLMEVLLNIDLCVPC